MISVRVIKDWSYPEINRQTPGGTGIWNNVKFTQDNSPCDYVIVLNTPLERVSVRCAAQNLWLLLQEPPNEITGWLQNGRKEYGRIYTTDPTKKGAHIVHSQTALPWHVDRDYDFLKQAKPVGKSKTLSWITSSKITTAGHRQRMAFLAKLQKQISFDLFGRGFTLIGDKWDGLSPYRYSVAVENHSNPYYWTEKIIDCFLAWTMPIYNGCTQITQYFPKESMILIDVNDPSATAIVQDAIQSHTWEKNLDAIEYARNQVLDEYQFFPFIANEISLQQQKVPAASFSRTWTLAPVKEPINRIAELKNRLNKYAFYKVLKHVYINLQNFKIKR
jgi:hypothetical protein